MMWKRYLVEFGTGADLHGMNVMEAAKRAVKDAVSHCCMCGLVDALGITDLKHDMRVVMKIAAPNPEAVDPEPLKKMMITENVEVEVVQGGLMLGGLHVDEFGEGDQIVIVNAGLTVYARLQGKDSMPLESTDDKRFLTDAEISELRTTLGKRDFEESDWDFFEEILTGKIFYTAYPEDLPIRVRYSEAGILEINGDLVVFSSGDAMENYFVKMGKPFTECKMVFDHVSFEQIVDIVKETYRDCLIDPHYPQNDNVLGFSGETRMITVYNGRSH